MTGRYTNFGRVALKKDGDRTLIRVLTAADDVFSADLHYVTRSRYTGVEYRAPVACTGGKGYCAPCRAKVPTTSVFVLWVWVYEKQSASGRTKPVGAVQLLQASVKHLQAFTEIIDARGYGALLDRDYWWVRSGVRGDYQAFTYRLEPAGDPSPVPVIPVTLVDLARVVPFGEIAALQAVPDDDLAAAQAYRRRP